MYTMDDFIIDETLYFGGNINAPHKPQVNHELGALKEYSRKIAPYIVVYCIVTHGRPPKILKGCNHSKGWGCFDPRCTFHIKIGRNRKDPNSPW